jgi:hypothetical protein
MNKLSGFLALSATFISFSAHADRNYVCTSPSTDRVENLQVKGLDKNAQVHLDDREMSGDYIYSLFIDSQATDDLDGTPEYLDLGFVGKITEKANQSQFVGAMFISPAVLSGSTGTIAISVDNQFTSFNCN